MKILTNKRILKIINILLITIMIMNSFMPICSYAIGEDEDEKTGGKLFKPIFKLFAGIGDLVIKGLQYLFIGDGNIKGGGIREIESEGSFLIRYSPAIIFSNIIPGLDANFIKPSVPDLKVENVNTSWEKVGDYNNLNDNELAENYEFSEEKAVATNFTTDNEWWNQFELAKDHAIFSWTDSKRNIL